MKEKEIAPASFPTPFMLMRRLSDEMERIFEDVGFRRPLTLTMPERRTFDWIPALEIFERDNRLFVRAELAGLTKEDVKIDVTDELLTIQGERKREKQEKKDGYIRSERSYGSFFRQVTLPDGVDSDAAKATFRNGILEIEMPVLVKKPEPAHRLKIEEMEKEPGGV